MSRLFATLSIALAALILGPAATPSAAMQQSEPSPRYIQPDISLPDAPDPEAEVRRCPRTANRVDGFREQVTCRCPARATDGDVWGTDVYKADSQICAAAVHAGIIGPSGGEVTFAMRFGRDDYEGSVRNGVTSQSYGRWTSSFVFPRFANLPDRSVERCPIDADSFTTLRERMTCRCTARATQAGTVWGSDTYTTDSEICRAALHAGEIGPNGGVVTFEIRRGRDTYEGSYRNTVLSEDYGSWPRSYVFPRFQ